DAEMGCTSGTATNWSVWSATNHFNGTGFYQTRPISLEKNNFFNDIAGRVAAGNGDFVTAGKLGKPNNPYYLGGGGFGGPIKQDRTFFWFAAENYTDTQTRNASELMPTDLERSGNFSRLTDGSGRPVIIYDPLTRLPFANNVIPAARLNQVALNMLKYLPKADTQLDNGST